MKAIILNGENTGKVYEIEKRDCKNLSALLYTPERFKQFTWYKNIHIKLLIDYPEYLKL